MKRAALILMLALFLTLGLVLPAMANTTDVPFLDTQDAYILSFMDAAGVNPTVNIQMDGKAAALMWVGTAGNSTLGNVYLWADNGNKHGVKLLSNGDLSAITPDPIDLILYPSPYCTFETDSVIEVHIENGIPSLRSDSVPLDTLVIKGKEGMTFSVPVKDQNGDPVPGAVFAVKGITYGGNDFDTFGNITSDANGILTFPMTLKPHLVYWFEQVSAPTGYETMPDETVEVRLTEKDGFAAYPYQSSGYADAPLTSVLNRKTTTTPPGNSGGQGMAIPAPTSTPNPGNAAALAAPAVTAPAPRTGDEAYPALYAVLALTAAAVWLLLYRKAAHQR